MNLGIIFAIYQFKILCIPKKPENGNAKVNE